MREAVINNYFGTTDLALDSTARIYDHPRDNPSSFSLFKCLNPLRMVTGLCSNHLMWINVVDSVIPAFN